MGIDDGLHLGVEEAYGVAPVLLGPVQGHLGLLEQALERAHAVVEQADADAQGGEVAVPRLATQHIRLLERLLELACDVLGVALYHNVEEYNGRYFGKTSIVDFEEIK